MKLTATQIQNKINKAQSLKEKAYNQSEAIESGALADTVRNNQVIERANESYEKLYEELVKDAQVNGWSINDFETTDFFDYETFDYEYKR